MLISKKMNLYAPLKIHSHKLAYPIKHRLTALFDHSTEVLSFSVLSALFSVNYANIVLPVKRFFGVFRQSGISTLRTVKVNILK